MSEEKNEEQDRIRTSRAGRGATLLGTGARVRDQLSKILRAAVDLGRPGPRGVGREKRERGLPEFQQIKGRAVEGGADVEY